MKWYWIVAIAIAGLFIWLMLSAIFYRRFFKRFYDLIFSLLAMIVLLPLLLALTVLGTIAMKGNPFFVQKRPGKKDKKTGREKIFKLIKFRTMTNERDETGALLPDEKRLKRYGSILRQLSLDELPELLNIIKGDLSIVGPRPQLVKDLVFMTEEQRRRHDVRQGLTGLAQCNGRNNMDWEKKFEYDLLYLKRISLWQDIGILFKTVFKVLKRDGITEEGMATAEDLGDYLLRKGMITEEEYILRTKEMKDY